jgi:hypothetical protein
MLNKKNYEPLIAPLLKDQDVVSKVSFGQSYETIYGEFYEHSWYDLNRMVGVWTPFDASARELEENSDFPGRRGTSPIYDPVDAQERIQIRIEKLKLVLSVSLPILTTQGWFMEMINELRADGWLDWQILHALGHAVVNHKVQHDKNFDSKRTDELRKRHLELFNKDESEWYQEINRNVLTLKQLRIELENMVPLAVLHAFGLENKSRRPEMQLIRDFLRNRFQFFEDGKEVNLFPTQDKV